MARECTTPWEAGAKGGKKGSGQKGGKAVFGEKRNELARVAERLQAGKEKAVVTRERVGSAEKWDTSKGRQCAREAQECMR